MGKPDNLHSAFRPDPFPYSLLVYRNAGAGSIKSYGFTSTPVLNWRASYVNQKATRFQTGDRKLHDMSLLNLQTWDRLSDGGVGAKNTTDATRYRWARNVFAGDAGEIKLSPRSNLLDPFMENVNGSWVMQPAAEKIIDILLWPGPKVAKFNAAGTSDAHLCVITANAATSTTRLYQLVLTASGANVIQLGKYAGVVATSVALHRNKLYLGQRPVAEKDATTCIKEIAWANNTFEIKNVHDNVCGELVYSDGRYLYRALGTEVTRKLDPLATTAWEGPVPIGDGSPIVGMATYGSEEGMALFVTTWTGLYRILEEDNTIKQAHPVDKRAATADDAHGVGLRVVNNELVWPYPRGILRHTLGATEGSSPHEDDGIPYPYRGIFNYFQDGIGGIYVSCNNYDPAGRPTIYRWQEGRWHPFLSYQDPSITFIKKLFWTNRQIAPAGETARLWSVITYGGVDRLAWVPMPTSSHNYRLLPQTQYPPSGYIDLPQFTSEFAKLEKNWAGVSLDFLEDTLAGSGSVQVMYCDKDEPTEDEHTYVGAYSCVPNDYYRNSASWVPAQKGVLDETRLRLDKLSLTIQLRLQLNRGTGAAYPDTGLRACDGTFLQDGTILLWGTAERGEVRPFELERGSADAALMAWTLAGWQKQDLDAANIKGVLQHAGNDPLVCGQLYHEGDQYAIAEWDRASSTFSYTFLGKRVAFAGKNDQYFVVIFEEQGTYTLYTRDVNYTWWDYRATFNGEVTQMKATGYGGFIVTGAFTTVTHGTTTTTISKNACFVGVTTWTVRDVIFPLDAYHVLNLRDMATHGGRVFIAMGDFDTGSLWSTASEDALHGPVPWQAHTTATGYGGVVTSVLSDYHLKLGFSTGHVYELTNTTTLTPIALPQDSTPMQVHLIGNNWAVGDWNQNVHAYDPRSSEGGMTIHGAQLLYLPAENLPLARPTPVVQRVGLWYLEFPVPLRQYTMVMEFADHQDNIDGVPNTKTAQQQFEELVELTECNELVSLVLPDRTTMRGWLGGLQYSCTSDERSTKDAPLNWRYNVQFTVTEVEDSQNMPLGYYLPGLKHVAS